MRELQQKQMDAKSTNWCAYLILLKRNWVFSWANVLYWVIRRESVLFF